MLTAGLCEFSIGYDGVCDAVLEVRRGGNVTAISQADGSIGNWHGEAPELVVHNDFSPRYAGRH